MIDIGQEIYGLVVSRNRPMLTALDLCIEQLERLSSGDPAIQYALQCARKAAEQERQFQMRHPSDDPAPTTEQPAQGDPSLFSG
jgi:hypothetical protein